MRVFFRRIALALAFIAGFANVALATDVGSRRVVVPLGALVPSFVSPAMRANPPDLFVNLKTNQAWKRAGNQTVAAASLLTVSRASSKTNLFPTSASGFAYATFLSNVLAVTSGAGANIEEARTNVLLNSTAPVTQNTASLATGTYTLWVNGSGSATSSAGTATITGAGAATNGTPNVFVVTVAGTVVITVSGSLNAFQCELGTFGTSLIVTAGATAPRAADVVTLTSPGAFGSAYTLYTRATPQAPTAYGSNQFIISASDGTVNNRSGMARFSATGNFEAVYTNAGATTNLGNGSLSQNVSSKTVGAFASGDQAGVLNGGAVATSSGTIATGFNTVSLGNRVDGALFLDGNVEEVAIWYSQRVPNAQLQSMTQ